MAVDRSGTPIAMISGYEENPNAMFVLWKDHSAIGEAAEINQLCHEGPVDYTRYEGGTYSSEWFWAKILHLLRADPAIRDTAYSWVEHCDWIPFLLTGGHDVHSMKRSRCAAGHKAMWHPDWNGLPPDSFFTQIDPLLEGLRDRLFGVTYTSDQAAGTLSDHWADRLGLSTSVVVAVGAFDAHMGAVGGQIEPYHLSKVMGTSTCDMLVAPAEEIGDKLIKGICGQVDGSVIPGMMGMEAGQSAFGDVYAWFREILMWPLENLLSQDQMKNAEREQLVEKMRDQMIASLTAAAEKVEPEGSALVAVDWLNGRRTPDANQALKGGVFGLNLGTDAPKLFRAMVESTCFGARKIVDRFQDEGIPIKGIIGLGGVAKKSPFVMQILADVLNRPIRIVQSEQTCALGAAMFAAVAAGIYRDIPLAMEEMGSGFDRTYEPRAHYAGTYDKLYEQYEVLGKVIENQISDHE